MKKIEKLYLKTRSVDREECMSAPWSNLLENYKIHDATIVLLVHAFHFKATRNFKFFIPFAHKEISNGFSSCMQKDRTLIVELFTIGEGSLMISHCIYWAISKLNVIYQLIIINFYIYIFFFIQFYKCCEMLAITFLLSLQMVDSGWININVGFNPPLECGNF